MNPGRGLDHSVCWSVKPGTVTTVTQRIGPVSVRSRIGEPTSAPTSKTGTPMTEERKHALLLAAAILAARKLAALENDRPSPAKLAAVETAIDRAKFILDRIDARWPAER